MTDLDKLAKSLTKEQRAYMLDLAEWRSLDGYSPKRWMTFPPANTHRVLVGSGLVDLSGQCTPLVLALRNHLKGQNDG